MSNRDIVGAPYVEPGQGSDQDWETTLHQPINFTADVEKKISQEQEQVFDSGKDAWTTVAGT
jgi:hypothetical protein